jgi:hypothetical protein
MEGVYFGRSRESSLDIKRGAREMRGRPHPVDLTLRLTSAHPALTRGREQVLVKRRRMGACQVRSLQISCVIDVPSLAGRTSPFTEPFLSLSSNVH